MGSKSSVGRFPMRNRFISDYIFETTGKRRTPKQVGGRIQRLRDTCKNDKSELPNLCFISCEIDVILVLQLVSSRTSRDASSGSQSGYSSSASPSVSPSPSPDLRHSVSMQQEHVSVKILLQNELWPAPTPTIQLSTDTNHPQSIQLSPSPQGGTMSQSKSSRNILPYLSGAIELCSSCALLLQSSFVVYFEGSNLPVHSEVASLKCISSPILRSGWLYSFDLVPTFGKVFGRVKVFSFFSDHQIEAELRAEQIFHNTTLFKR